LTPSVKGTDKEEIGTRWEGVEIMRAGENKKAQLMQRERATAVHVCRPTANKCKIRKNLYSSAQGHSRSLLSVSIETRV